jgi:hypothetical protein
MWNLSYRWQRQVRIGTGAAVLVGSLVGLLVLANTAPARRAAAGGRDLLEEMRSASSDLVEVTVDSRLGARPRTLVYLEREDGVAQVVGRVIDVSAVDAGHVRLQLHLASPIGGASDPSGVIKGAPASLDLREAVQLMLSPGTPNEEAAVARDMIWPSVRTYVMPAMTDGLIREVSQQLASLDEPDQALFAQTISRLREELKPLENRLVDRLARRSWEVVGVKGLATGIWRSTAANVQTKSVAISDFWWRILGASSNTPPTERPFFSDDTVNALRTGLESETIEFWKQYRAEIVDALIKVIGEQRPQFEEAFANRWAVRLYERAVLPAWQEGQDEVLSAVQAYANDFAARRLLTRQGGPRLLFAYALRSALKISDAPLLVFAPGPSVGPQRITYQPFLR